MRISNKIIFDELCNLDSSLQELACEIASIKKAMVKSNNKHANGTKRKPGRPRKEK